MDTRDENSYKSKFIDKISPNLLLIFVIVSWMIWLIAGISFISISENPGIFGDWFGALNTLFSGLVFIYVARTLQIQAEELSQQREELRLQREQQYQPLFVFFGGESQHADDRYKSFWEFRNHGKLCKDLSLEVHHDQLRDKLSLSSSEYIGSGGTFKLLYNDKNSPYTYDKVLFTIHYTDIIGKRFKKYFMANLVVGSFQEISRVEFTELGG